VETSISSNPDATAANGSAAFQCWNTLDGTPGGTDGTASAPMEINVGRSGLNNTLSWVAVFPNVPTGSHMVAVVCKVCGGSGGQYNIGARILAVRGVG
jgi:hypothetical protein